MGAVSDSDRKPSTMEVMTGWLTRDAARIFIMMLPLSLIILSAYCYISYSQRLDNALDTIQDGISKALASGIHGTLVPQPLGRQDILLHWGAAQSIPDLTTLQVLYLGIFLCAELAFVLMALREYAYGTLHISEHDVLSGALSSGNPGATPVDDDLPAKEPAPESPATKSNSMAVRREQSAQ